jgi:hypothetical protein
MKRLKEINDYLKERWIDNRARRIARRPSE